MKRLADILKNRKQDTSKSNDYRTELRVKTSKMLGVSLKQVCGMTAGWNNQQIESLLNECMAFANPPALWWKKWKVLKLRYGTKRKNKKDIQRVREARRIETEIRKGKQLLFTDW